MHRPRPTTPTSRALAAMVIIVALFATPYARADVDRTDKQNGKRSAKRPAAPGRNDPEKPAPARNDPDKADPDLEPSIADALDWLARHQREDGIWDRARFDQLCPADDTCSQTAIEHIDWNADVGVSAFAALAFINAGYTHETGPYTETLSKVFSYILAQQTPDGTFSPGSPYQMYNDALACLAMAELYARTRDPILREPIERSLAHLARAQQREGGFDWTADPATGRNDTTVTTWVLMAFNAAEAADMHAPIAARFRLLAHFDRATLADGRVWYADRTRAKPGRESRELGTGERRTAPSLTATGLWARSVFGLRLDSDIARLQTTSLLASLPTLDELKKERTDGWHNEYYWLHGTMAMYHVGGDAWTRWRNAVRLTILEHQERPTTRKGKRGHRFGSWPAFGRDWGEWGRTGGRIHATAVSALASELYYGRLPKFLTTEALIGPSEIRDYMARLSPRDHGHILDLAVRLVPDTGEPILLDLLESMNDEVKVAAALALGDLDSPMGRGTLLAAKEMAVGERRDRIEAALRRIDAKRPKLTYGKIVELNSQARMLLFETGGKPLYYGQTLRVLRDDKPIGRIVVNRRFTGERAAAARIESADVELKAGDLVATINE